MDVHFSACLLDVSEVCVSKSGISAISNPECGIRELGRGGNQRMEAATHHEHVQGKKIFLFVWFWLLALTAGEVLLAYQQLALKVMLILLMGLSIIKASLIISYFMHL